MDFEYEFVNQTCKSTVFRALTCTYIIHVSASVSIFMGRNLTGLALIRPVIILVYIYLLAQTTEYETVSPVGPLTYSKNKF